MRISSCLPAIAVRTGVRALAFALLTATTLEGCVSPLAMYGVRATAADSVARAAIATEQSIKVADIPMNTLTVAPLRVLSTDTSYAPLGFGMAALLMTDLSQTKKVTLVERMQMDAVLRELKLSQSGRVDTLTAPRVGRIVGARRIIVGSIDLRSPATMHISSYVANAVTGGIGASLTGSAKLSELFDAEKALAFQLLEALGITLTPAERRAIELRPTRSLNAFLAYSRGVQAEAARDFSGAMSNYSTAVRLDPGFAAAGDALSSIQGSGETGTSAAATPLERAAGISTDLVNHPAPVVVGTGADAPIASRPQTVTFTVIIRTP